MLQCHRGTAGWEREKHLTYWWERRLHYIYKKFREDVYTNTRSNRDYTLLYMMCDIVTIVTHFASRRYVPSF